MKLIKEDDKLYHFKGKEGEFKIVKKGLSKSAQDKINKIKQAGGAGVEQALASGGEVQRFYDAGEVQPATAQFDMPVQGDADEDPTPINPGQSVAAPAPLLDPSLTDISAGYQGPGSPLAQQASTVLPAAPVAGDSTVAPQPTDQSQNVAVQPTPPKDPFDLKSLVTDQGALYQKNAKIQSDQLKAQAKEQADFLYQQQLFNADSATNHQYLNDQYDALSKKAQNSEVDPNHYVNNMGTGSKIAATLGILLSGLGAGAHGTNLALGVLQDHINKDIDAQKANIGQTNSLLNENLKATGNLYQAENATRAQMYAMYSGKIQQMASQAGSDTALNQGLILKNQLKIAAQPAIQAQNMYQMQQKVLADPNSSPVARMMAMSGGKMNPALLMQLQKSDQVKQQNALELNQASDLYDKAEKDLRDGKTIVNSRAMDGLEGFMSPIAHANGYKGPQQHEFIDKYKPTRSDIEAKDRQGRKNNFLQMVRNKQLDAQAKMVNGLGGSNNMAADDGDQ